MMRRLIYLVLFVSCHNLSAYQTLVPDETRATPEVRTSCEHAARMCTQCHTIDRVIAVGSNTKPQWELLVNRMRHMPSSGISETDAAVIVECLANRGAPK